nr:MAG TPA: hypothetical protein [Caudoviricetes sp.]
MGCRLCSLPGSYPINYVLAASLCFVFAREHSCNPAPIEYLSGRYLLQYVLL